MGDFNAHSHLWDCHKTTIRGKQFEDFLLKHNLSVLNDGSPSYLHPATGSLFAIDLSITDPSLFLDFSCSDQHGSDHFPIVIRTTHFSPPVINSTWKLSKSDWSSFCQKAHLELGLDTELDMADFSSKLYNIALTAIPKSKPHSKKASYCTVQWRLQNSHQSQEKGFKNISHNWKYRKIQDYRAKARRIVKYAKRRSWQNFVSKINSRTSIKKVWTMVRKLAGKYHSGDIPHLEVNNNKITDIQDISNELLRQFLFS